MSDKLAISKYKVHFKTYNIWSGKLPCKLQLVIDYRQLDSGHKVMNNLFSYSFLAVTYSMKCSCSEEPIWTKDFKYIKLERLF